jgi:hypothetical protein
MNKYLKTVLFGFIFLTTSYPAFAEKWVHIGSVGDYNNFLDIDNLKRVTHSGEIYIQGLVKSVPDPNAQQFQHGFKGHTTITPYHMIEADCNTGYGKSFIAVQVGKGPEDKQIRSGGWHFTGKTDSPYSGVSTRKNVQFAIAVCNALGHTDINLTTPNPPGHSTFAGFDFKTTDTQKLTSVEVTTNESELKMDDEFAWGTFRVKVGNRAKPNDYTLYMNLKNCREKHRDNVSKSEVILYLMTPSPSTGKKSLAPITANITTKAIARSFCTQLMQPSTDGRPFKYER